MTSPRTITLPHVDGSLEVRLNEPKPLETSDTPSTSRVVFSAGHVVSDPLRACAGASSTIDWDATLALRHNLWDLGLGIAESMDTAQRGMGLTAEDAMRLAERTLAEARTCDGQVVVGITTDSIDEAEPSLERIIDAYTEQLSRIESAGGQAVMMASRHLARTAASADDYVKVYESVLDTADTPVVLHWLGSMFDPALAGYWGSTGVDQATETVLQLIESRRRKVAGIKLSLLDLEHEISFRRRLPGGVRLFTGDDYNYSQLIAGDEHGYSDALLGAFAAVPRFASAALRKLDHGDSQGFRAILDPTVPLSRLIFETPTQYYKVGVAWLSYLTGWQSHFRMIAGFETGRSVSHLSELFDAANSLGLFPDPDLTAARACAYFHGQGL